MGALEITTLELKDVVFRRVEDPPPVFDYGIAWMEPASTPAVTAFVDLATKFSDKEPTADG